MKQNFKKILVFIFTLSIMLLNAGNVMAKEIGLHFEDEAHTLRGGQDYYFIIPDDKEYKHFYCEIPKESKDFLTMENYLYKEGSDTKTTLSIHVKSFGTDNNRAIEKTINCYHKKRFLSKYQKFTKTLTLTPNKFTNSASIKTGGTFSFNVSNVSICSFDHVADVKFLYSDFLSGDRSIKASLTLKDHNCSFSSNSPGKYSVYIVSGTNTYEWTIDVTDKPTDVTDKSTYQITYDKNAPKKVEKMPSQQVKTFNENLTLSPNIPTRGGYTFQGWNTRKDGTGKSYGAYGVYKDNASVTLYAQWKEENKNTKTNATAGTNAAAGTNATAGTNAAAGTNATAGTKPPATEINVSKTEPASDFTPGYRFVTNLVTGTSLTCGDRVYVSSCNGLVSNPNSKCTISERNGIKPNSNLIINRNALSINEPTDCDKTVRYSIEAKAFTNSNLRDGELIIPCGAEVVFKQFPYKACNFGSKTNNLGIESGYQYCEVEYNGEIVYVDRGGLATNKPIDSVCSKTCVSATPLLNQTLTTEKPIKICYENNKSELTPIGPSEYEVLKCGKGYRRVMREDLTYNTCNELLSNQSDGECSKVFLYSCISTSRPTLKGSGNLVRQEDGKGSLTFKGFDSDTGSGLKGYFIYTEDIPTVSSIPTPFENSNYEVYENFSAGIYFVSVITNDNAISYPLALSIYSDDITTTADMNLGSPDGKETYLLDGINNEGPTAYNSGVLPSRYALLSNKLTNDSILASGFDLFTTAYQVNVEADKVAVFATLTSSDASFVPGYGPRTVNLNYGKNIILVKIINKEGKERTYTFIVNRKDNRENDNLLSNLKPSAGDISFDPYVTDYTVSVPKNKKTVSINASLKNKTASFVSGYEPRRISLDNDITSAIIRTVSEAGITRNYVLTFVKKGAETASDINSTYLSSLTIPGTEIMFDKETESYNVSVEYEIDNVDIYAFAESPEATVSVEGNSNLRVGANRVEIIVSNGSASKIYSVYINRKEDSLGVSNNTKLDTLTIKDYNLFFDPDESYYKVKIKREKTLLLTATPASNRSLVYMEGNNDLTAFSTVRVKVIAENGETGLYSIDIVKDLYNAKFETTAAIIGVLIVVGSIILFTIKKKRKSLKEYIEE